MFGLSISYLNLALGVVGRSCGKAATAAECFRCSSCHRLTGSHSKGNLDVERRGMSEGCQGPKDTGWWFGTWILFFHVLGIVIPTDFHIFQRGRSTTNQDHGKWALQKIWSCQGVDVWWHLHPSLGQAPGGCGECLLLARWFQNHHCDSDARFQSLPVPTSPYQSLPVLDGYLAIPGNDMPWCSLFKGSSKMKSHQKSQMLPFVKQT